MSTSDDGLSALSVGTDWSMLSTDQALRAIALQSAVATVGTVVTNVVAAATQFYLFLTQPSLPTPPFVLTGSAGPVRQQPVTKEPDMSMQIADNQYFILTIAEADSKGVPINTDTLTWTPSDPTVVTVDLSVDPSTYKGAIVAGNPGETDVVISDGTVTFTEHVTVVPGGVATMSATEGPVLQQPVTPIP